MDGASSEGSEARFATYVEALGAVLGHADRREPMRDYCLGLLMPIARKSVEPMAAVTAPAQVAAKHQSLLHFVGNAPWSDAAMLAKVSELVLPTIERSGPVEARIIDDTGFPKKGQHSVGVTRQYCGQLGKRDNCQVAVTLSLANHHASLPVAYRLYLSEDWAEDRARRDKARVPETIAFQTKPEIAFEQIKAARSAGLPCGDAPRAHAAGAPPTPPLPPDSSELTTYWRPLLRNGYIGSAAPWSSQKSVLMIRICGLGRRN